MLLEVINCQFASKKLFGFKQLSRKAKVCYCFYAAHANLSHTQHSLNVNQLGTTLDYGFIATLLSPQKPPKEKQANKNAN